MEPSQTTRNLVRHEGSVTAADRQRVLGQRGGVVWLTGLSGSGKSTIAHRLEERLIAAGNAACVLDGDNVRHGLNSDLGFGPADRDENIRRIGEVAALMAEAGLITITAFISPYRAGRDGARRAAGDGRFVEVYLDVPLAQCERRDPKGLYRKARQGEIAEFTGISAPYEPPLAAELTLDAGSMDVDRCVGAIESYLKDNDWLSPPGAAETQGSAR